MLVCFCEYTPPGYLLITTHEVEMNPVILLSGFFIQHQLLIFPVGIIMHCEFLPKKIKVVLIIHITIKLHFTHCTLLTRQNVSVIINVSHGLMKHLK